MNQGENNQKQFNINSESGAIDFQSENQEGTIFEEHGTFCRVGSAANGILEVDLQSVKAKGVEIRNISFAIPLGVDEQNNPMKAEMLFMDEKDFEKFKAFITKLNWND
jgi:hypothetical protein